MTHRACPQKRAPATSPHPTDRGTARSKHHLLTDANEIPNIRGRVARALLESRERSDRYRWVVERTLVWLHRFRRLRVRDERRSDMYDAFLHLPSRSSVGATSSGHARRRYALVRGPVAQLTRQVGERSVRLAVVMHWMPEVRARFAVMMHWIPELHVRRVVMMHRMPDVRARLADMRCPPFRIFTRPPDFDPPRAALLPWSRHFQAPARDFVAPRVDFPRHASRFSPPGPDHAVSAFEFARRLASLLGAAVD